MSEFHIVTGAAGFIGRCLIKRLLATGAEVAGFDNLCRGTLKNIAEFAAEPRFQFTRADVADAGALQAGFAAAMAGKDPKATTVWHLAANSDIPAGVKDPAVDLRDTFMTTYCVAHTMGKFGLKKIAFASTSAVYGALKEPLHEAIGPLFPIANYGAMKLASEAVITAAVESHLAQAWIFRFPNVIGGFATHGVIYDFSRKLRRDPNKLVVLGNGRQQKAYLLVDELVDAMLFVKAHASERINCFNVGPADEGVTVRFIAEETARVAAPGAVIEYTGGDRGWIGDVPKFVYSTHKLNALGWTPRLSSADAIRAAVPQIWSESE